MKQELVVVPKTLPVEIGALPPRPVWQEHINAYMARAESFTCLDRAGFDAAKILASEGTQLKNQIKQSYDPLTQAIDAIKTPIIQQRDEDMLSVTNTVKKIDAKALAWKEEQDRIAREKAEQERQAEIKRREDARQAEIKRQEEERQAEIKRRDEQRAKDLEIAGEWAMGDTVELPPVEEPPPVVVPEVIPPRHVNVDAGFSYRKGARTKPKMVITVVDPDAVNRAYCSPDKVKYEAKAKSYFTQIQNPTPEQIKKIETEIGGVSITWE